MPAAATDIDAGFVSELVGELLRRSNTAEQAVEGLIEASQQEADDLQAAENARACDSSIGEDSESCQSYSPQASQSSDPSLPVRTGCWWANKIKEHARQLVRCEAEPSAAKHTRTVLSACTGCFAEAEVLKACGMRIVVCETVVSC